jgi:hypothetical protein
MTAMILVRVGSDLPTIRAFLGHCTLVTTLRHVSYADDTAASRVARALDRLNAAAAPPQAGAGG